MPVYSLVIHKYYLDYFAEEAYAMTSQWQALSTQTLVSTYYCLLNTSDMADSGIESETQDEPGCLIGYRK